MAVLCLAQLRCVPLSDVLFPELFAGSTQIARHARPPVVFSEDHGRPRFRLQGGVPRPLTVNAIKCKRPDNRTFAGRFDRGMIVPEVPEMLRVQPDL